MTSVPAAHRRDVKGQIRDGHGLREQACELSVDANRRIQEQDRRPEGGGPERRLPPRTGQGRAGFEPLRDVRAIRPVLHQRLGRRLPFHLRLRALGSVIAMPSTCGIAPKRAENEGVQRLLVVELHGSAFNLLHRPLRLPHHGLKLRSDPLLQTVDERFGALRHEPAGVLRRARQSQEQGNADRERDQRAQADRP